MKQSNKKNQVGELIFGIHPIVEVLKAKRRKVLRIYTTRPTPVGWQKIEKQLPAYPLPIQYVTKDVLSRMVQTADHQSVVAWVGSFPFRKQIFTDIKRYSFLVMLDGIQDPRNVGAILRSAYCTGITGVIMTHKHAAPLNAVALKASAGLAEYLDIYKTTSVQSAVQELQKAGYNVLLATLDGVDARTYTYTVPLCIVIGSEGKGISPSIFSMGEHITLAQRSHDISYNASVAAGILLFLAGTVINQLSFK